MRAAQFYGQRDIRVLDISCPVPKPDEVLVSVEWCGICGSDLHEYLTGTFPTSMDGPNTTTAPSPSLKNLAAYFRQGPGVIPTPTNPHPLTHSTLPITLGHEFCGRILDPRNSSLAKNQAVMVDPRLYCRSCSQCTSAAGTTNGCQQWGFLGLSGGGGGGLSETVAVDARMCYPLPDSVSLLTAALIEPLSVAYHALGCAGASSFKELSVLVLGGGPVGLAVIVCLRAQGVAKVFVSEPTLKRREQSARFADVVLDPFSEHVSGRCRSLTDGRGVDIVFDCAGIQAGLEAGLDALAFRGIYVNVAGWEKPMQIPFLDFMTKEVTMKASFAYNDEDFRAVVDGFKTGRYKDVEKLITSRILLEDVVRGGFEELVTNKDSHVKILVTPRRDLLLRTA